MISTSKASFLSLLFLTQNFYLVHGKGDSVWDKTKSYLDNEHIWFGVKTVVVGGVAMAAAPAALAAAGFTGAGVAAGSMAAVVQSTWFGGAVTGITGAAFSAAQTAGVVGLGSVANTAILTTTGGILKAWDSMFGGSGKGPEASPGNLKFKEDVPRYCKYNEQKGKMECKDGQEEKSGFFSGLF